MINHLQVMATQLLKWLKMSQGGEKEMPDNLIGEVRRSAVVMTYAPGSIMDMRADGGPVSVVCAGLEEWDSSAPIAKASWFTSRHRLSLQTRHVRRNPLCRFEELQVTIVHWACGHVYMDP